MLTKRLTVAFLALFCAFCTTKPEEKETKDVEEENIINIASPCFFSISASQIEVGKKLTFQIASAYSWREIQRINVLGRELTEAQPTFELSPTTSGIIKGVAIFNKTPDKTCNHSIIVKPLEKDIFCTLSTSNATNSATGELMILSLNVGGLDANTAIASSIEGYDLGSSQGGQRQFPVTETTTFLGKVKLPNKQEAVCSIVVDVPANTDTNADSNPDINVVADEKISREKFCDVDVSAKVLDRLEVMNIPLFKDYQLRLTEIRKSSIPLGSKEITNFRRLFFYGAYKDACEAEDLKLLECIDHGPVRSSNSSDFKIGHLSLGKQNYEYLIVKPDINYEIYHNSEQNEVLLYQDSIEIVGKLAVELCECQIPASMSNSLKRDTDRFAPPLRPEFTMLVFKKNDSSSPLSIIGDKVNRIKHKRHEITKEIVEPKSGEVKPICKNDWNIQT